MKDVDLEAKAEELANEIYEESEDLEVKIKVSSHRMLEETDVHSSADATVRVKGHVPTPSIS